VHAHLGRHARDQQAADAALVEQVLQLGGVEGAFAGLVDDGLARCGLQFVDDVVGVFAADEDAAFGPCRPILPRASLAGGQSDRSGRWPSRVWMTGRPAVRQVVRNEAIGNGRGSGPQVRLVDGADPHTVVAAFPDAPEDIVHSVDCRPFPFGRRHVT
jgi:hypothetical protein